MDHTEMIVDTEKDSVIGTVSENVLIGPTMPSKNESIGPKRIAVASKSDVEMKTDTGVSADVIKKPKNEEEFDETYAKALQMFEDFDNSHLHDQVWTLLIDASTLKPNPKETLLQCFKDAIHTCPTRAFEKVDTKFVENLYKKVCYKEIDHSDIRPILDIAEKKLGLSYMNASSFWSTVLYYEKKLAEDLPDDQKYQRIIDIYVKQFSNGYYNMDNDWNKFCLWNKENNIPENLRNKVQMVFMNSVPETYKINDFYEELVDSRIGHHLPFEEWIQELILKKCDNADTIEVLCEELVLLDQKSFCFYWIYLNALASDKFPVGSEKAIKIVKVIKKAIKNVKEEGCPNMAECFLENSLVIASGFVPAEQVLGLIDEFITAYQPKPDSLSYWCARSCGIVRSIANMIRANRLEKEKLDTYFEKALLPFTDAFFKYSDKCTEDSIPKDVDYCAAKCIKLLKLYFLNYQNINQMSDGDLVSKWTAWFYNNKSPLLLLAYCDFVRERSDYATIAAAYQYGLEQVELISTTEATYLTRRVHLKMLQDYSEVIKVHGDISKQIEIAAKIQNRFSSYTSKTIETHSLMDVYENMAHSEQLIHNAYESESSKILSQRVSTGNPCDPKNAFKQKKAIAKARQHKNAKTDQCEVNAKTDSSLESSLSTALDAMRVDKKSDQEQEPIVGFPVFISNLNYKATENDVKTAFKREGLCVNGVVLKKNSKGFNLGYGSVYFKSQDDANFAINNLDHMKVCNRVTFLSAHRSNKVSVLKEVDKGKGPWILKITDLPKGLDNQATLMARLSEFGRVKSILMWGNRLHQSGGGDTKDSGQPEDDLVSKATAIVEFDERKDAENVWQKWGSNYLFVDQAVQIEKDYGGTKLTFNKGNVEPRKSMPRNIKRKTSETDQEKNSTSSTTSSQEDSNVTQSKILKKSPSKFAFVPQQVRRVEQTCADSEPNSKPRRRTKLGVPVIEKSSTKQNAVESSSNETPTSGLNNADFRKMLGTGKKEHNGNQSKTEISNDDEVVPIM